MKTSALVGVVLMGILIVAGCALKFKQPTGESMPVVKAMRAQQIYLEQQVQSLNDLNEKLTEHSDSLEARLRRGKTVKKAEDSEAEARQTRLKQLEQAVADLTAQYDALQVGFQKLKQENNALKKTVARSRKPRETRQLIAQNRNDAQAQPKSKAGHARKKEPLQKQRKAAAKPQRTPNAAEQPPQTVAVQTPASPQVNINLASLNDLTSYLGLPKETAEQLVSHRPYRIKGELVAKQIVPRETFYQIKDRMTAAQ